jgi:AcrR family transcriptional regulator
MFENEPRNRMNPKKKPDRRTTRTRRQLSQALVDLVQEKRFDDITVQNVIDRADVGRSTFYAHFQDKEDLFQKDWERFLDHLVLKIDWENVGSKYFFPIAHLFEHLKEFHSFYRGLVRSRKSDAVFKFGQRYLSGKIEEALASKYEEKPTKSVPISILSNYLAVQTFSLLQWWLDNNMPFPPERMEQIFHELVTPTVQNVLTATTRKKV